MTSSDPAPHAPFFDDDTRNRLAAEDSEAWRSVTGLLLAIIAGGVLIAVLAVAICSRTPL